MRSIICYSGLVLVLALSGCSGQQAKPIEDVAPAPALTQEDSKPKAYIKVDTDTSIRADEVRIGRYSTTSATATTEQFDLFNVIIQTTLPFKIKTIGDGVDYLLLRSGYTMADKSSQGEDVKQLLSKSLPYAHRKLRHITLKNALLVLVGNAYWMKIDPVHRLVAFDTIEEFK